MIIMGFIGVLAIQSIALASVIVACKVFEKRNGTSHQDVANDVTAKAQSLGGQD